MIKGSNWARGTHGLWWALGLAAAVGLAGAQVVPKAQPEPDGQAPRILSLTFPRVVPPDGTRVEGVLWFEDADHDARTLELSVVRAFDFAPLAVPISLAVQTPGETVFSLAVRGVQPVALEARVVDAAGHRSAPRVFHFVAAGADRLVAPDVYFINAWGERGRGPGQFDFEGPHGIRVGPDFNVYVVDQGNHRIQVFDPQGAYLTEWGRQGRGGPGRFNFPSDLVFDSAGNIFVSDSLNHRIQVFDPAREYLFEWGELGDEPGQFNAPRGLAINSRGELIVADELNSRIQAFDLQGNFLREWGRRGVNPPKAAEDPGRFDVIVGLDVDAEDNVYVADGFNHRVQVFDSQGNFLRQWGVFGDGEGQFDDPVGVAVAPEGWVAVTDTSPIRTDASGVLNDRVHLWTAGGAPLRVWGSESDAPGAGFKLPLGADTDGLGMLYIGDHFNRRAQAFYVALDPQEIAAADGAP